ncbi:SDR family NAD(P)-dependent oxidoreductase [Nocardia sp. NPDC051750]|uniref:SDR family NAD(P)-dependent oxidoreductase n=1 Tax=Nocardia sp. NPDC051750 TaxID=3364325 RepID=UPI00379509B2
MGEYSDQNVVITGGSSGMGFALAKLLAEGGARVVITGRSQTTLGPARDPGQRDESRPHRYGNSGKLR